ncbi:MAG: response regulator [Butyrivibrio sp.]|uniref:response regulator n=1 Tax=Butyrivibrio sp. TaxID=28121 RepID=UPI001B15D0B2|nr:response regulator [Butyrivibrio sp.]MBO6240133.1 response regulator [Butyrivibrio sp.]
MVQNLLIVDDEREILSWLEEMFRFEHPEELSVYTASSALEAIKLLSKIRFDVVLTDIKMPGMDGITLFKHVKENWPRCRTVFLTGYRNFEDIYSVINNPGVKYVLKSEDDEVIKRQVEASLTEAKEEVLKLQNQDALDKLLEESARLMLKDFFDRLLRGERIENIDEKLKKLGSPLRDDKVLSFLIRLERDEENENFYSFKLLKEGIFSDELRTSISDRFAFYVHDLENDLMLLMVQPNNKRKSDEEWQMDSYIIQGALEYVQERFLATGQGSFSIVVPRTAQNFDKLWAELKILKSHLAGFLGRARGAILLPQLVGNSDALEDRGSELFGPDVYSYTMRMRNYLELRKKEKYFEILDEISDYMIKAQSMHDPYSLQIYYGISVFLLQFINSNNLNEAIAFKSAPYKLTMAQAHESWKDAADYLEEISKAVFTLLTDNDSSISDRALKRVIDYIDEHLSDELSLTALAEVGGFNSSYLSRLFKQEMQRTLSDYILDKRIALAKNLLETPGIQIQAVAEKTGYISPHSFTRAFKMATGLSPTEYREMRMEQK